MQAEDLDALAREAGAADLSPETAAAIIRAVTARLGFEDEQPDEDGSVELLIDETVPVTLAHLPGSPSLLASAPVLALGAVRGDVLRYLLRANMAPGLTAGGSFGIAPGDDVVRFSRHIVAGKGDLTRIAQELDTFVMQVRTWTDQIDLYLDAIDDPDEGRPLEGQPEDGRPGARAAVFRA